MIFKYILIGILLNSLSFADNQYCLRPLKAIAPISIKFDSRIVLYLLNRSTDTKTLKEYRLRREKIDEQLAAKKWDIAGDTPNILRRKLKILDTIRMESSSTIKVKDVAEKSWRNANKQVEVWATSGEPFNIEKLKQINRLLRAGSYGGTKWGGVVRSYDVAHNGHLNYPPTSDVLKLLKQFEEWYQINEPRLHPIELAARSYQFLVSIHPFRDGNGRTTRLAMDYILLSHGYPPWIPKEGGKGQNLALYAQKESKDNFPPDRALQVGIEGMERTLKTLFLKGAR